MDTDASDLDLMIRVSLSFGFDGEGRRKGKEIVLIGGFVLGVG